MYIVIKPFSWYNTYKCNQFFDPTEINNEIVVEYLISNGFLVSAETGVIFDPELENYDEIQAKPLDIEYILPTSDNTFNALEWFANLPKE